MHLMFLTQVKVILSGHFRFLVSILQNEDIVDITGIITQMHRPTSRCASVYSSEIS